MTQTVKKTLRDSAGMRWTALLLLALAMFCSYVFMDILSPIKDLMQETRGWDSAAFGRMGIPLSRLPGRFQFFRDGRLYEAQQYLAFAREDETPCEGAIREFIRRTEAREAGRRARLLPRLPRRITAEYVARRTAEESSGGKCPVGIGCISCGPAYLDLFRHGALVIAGCL
jgi:hypothetical protein